VADAGSVWGEEARWYPEVVAVGDARRAWQAEFDRQGIPLRVHPGEGVNPHRTAVVDNGELVADLLLSPWQPLLRLALRTGRSTLLQGNAVDLASAAGAAWLWLSGTRPGQVAAAWPFLGSVALAEARERGDHRESSWLWLYENHCAHPVGIRLRSFIALAFHEPRLRMLRPYTSHWTLCFSRTPQWPSPGTNPRFYRPRLPAGMWCGRARAESTARRTQLMRCGSCWPNYPTEAIKRDRHRRVRWRSTLLRLVLLVFEFG
jgi:hypothetical protein